MTTNCLVQLKRAFVTSRVCSSSKPHANFEVPQNLGTNLFLKRVVKLTKERWSEKAGNCSTNTFRILKEAFVIVQPSCWSTQPFRFFESLTFVSEANLWKQVECDCLVCVCVCVCVCGVFCVCVCVRVCVCGVWFQIRIEYFYLKNCFVFKNKDLVCGVVMVCVGGCVGGVVFVGQGMIHIRPPKIS